MTAVETEHLTNAAAGLQWDAPYIGLLPYTRNEAALLFGRDEDARLLSDKIFAARLTVLYGTSGLGKSSVLKAKVVPLLEGAEAQTFFFDLWSGPVPLDDLKLGLALRASELGVPAADAGSPSLADLVGFILARDDRTFVLILDQFEEFLVNRALRLDPMKRELAELVRQSNIDVRIVLSLREEFLAALEPFHSEILDLFSSTYRLAPLTPNSERDAIVEPAKAFGAKIEDVLVERIIEDARGRSDGVRGRAPAEMMAGMDLPLMQILCSRLWDASHVREQGVLTLRLYQLLGGRRGILDGYIREVMPRGRGERHLVARLMKLLAPASGLKTAFSPRDLAQATERPVERIRPALAKLAEARVLRPRRHGEITRYEIQHDALIGIVAPWRDGVLKNEKRLRIVLYAMVGAAAVAGLFGYRKELARREYYANTDAVLEDACRDDRRAVQPEAMLIDTPKGQYQAEIGSGPAFDSVARYLLYPEASPHRFDEVKRLFQAYAYCMPKNYGINDSGLRVLPPPIQLDENWPITLTYSDERDLDDGLFQLKWHEMARSFAEEWAIPVPNRIRLDPTSALRHEDMRLEVSADDIEPVQFKTDAPELAAHFIRPTPKSDGGIPLLL
jgi:hypothetical protein